MSNKWLFFPTAMVQDDLICHLDAGNSSSYPGSGTTWTDLSGNDNTGTLVNGVSYSSSDGGSLVFDGSNDYVKIVGPALAKGKSELTICMFINPSSSGYRGSIWGEGAGANDGNWWQYNIMRGMKWRTRDTSTGSQGSRNNDISVDYFTADTWQYMSAVYSVSGGFKTFYINAVQKSTTTTSVDALTTARNLDESQIGKPTDPNDSSDNYFTGNIATVEVYDKALTATEIQANFDSRKSRFSL